MFGSLSGCRHHSGWAGSVQSGSVSKVLVDFINGSRKRETPKNSSVDRQYQLPVAAILFLSHRWEEVEKQSFRVKGLELSVGQRGGDRFTSSSNKETKKQINLKRAELLTPTGQRR